MLLAILLISGTALQIFTPLVIESYIDLATQETVNQSLSTFLNTFGIPVPNVGNIFVTLLILASILNSEISAMMKEKLLKNC